MSEPTVQDVRAAVARLAETVDRLEDDDPAGRERLLAVVEGLQARLERHGSDEDTERAPLAEEHGDNALLDVVETYEARHPQLTLMVNDILTRLASMGI